MCTPVQLKQKGRAALMDNQQIADRLREHARALEQEGDLFRVRAYRRAAEAILRLDRPAAEIVAHDGRKGLEAVAGVGSHLALTIERLIRTGEFHTPVPDAVSPEQHVSNVPGVGAVLANLLDERLHVRTVPELRAADEAGRLDELGLGATRLRKLRAALADNASKRQPAPPVSGEPSVAELLAIDQEYRRQAGEGRLPLLAPHRENPAHEAWLPLYHTRRGGWRYRALYSNTALAHRLGRTSDWVVIYFDGDATADQRTVVTETRGDLHGLRVVRGREEECRAYYRQTARAG
jgi:hypothetical protein